MAPWAYGGGGNARQLRSTRPFVIALGRFKPQGIANPGIPQTQEELTNFRIVGCFGALRAIKNSGPRLLNLVLHHSLHAEYFDCYALAVQAAIARRGALLTS